MVNKMKEFKTYEEFVLDAKKRDPKKWDEIQFHSDLIAKIVVERNKKGISQEKLAEMTGLKQSAIARIESCKCVPKITTIQNILLKLDMTLDIKRYMPVFESKGKVVTLYSSSEYGSTFNEGVKWEKPVVNNLLSQELVCTIKECV